jgi:hypothetical protein
VTNAALVPGSLNLFIDNQAVLLPDSLTYGMTTLFTLSHNNDPSNPLSGITHYMNISYGYRQMSFKMPGTINNLVSVNNYFEPGDKYSLFIADTLTHGQLQYVLLQDKVNYPDSSKSQVRFINLSPDAPSMDVWGFFNAGTDGTKIFSNRGFIPYHNSTIPEVQSFTSIKAGPYYFIATEAGTGNIILEGGLILPGGSVVTIYARGLVSGTGDKQIAVGVIEYVQ